MNLVVIRIITFIKKTFKSKNKVKIILTRDSVCYEDSINAPHKKILKLELFSDPSFLIKTLGYNYIPYVSGKNHSWICKLNGDIIGIVNGNNFDNIVKTVNGVQFSKLNKVHFNYKY